MLAVSECWASPGGVSNTIGPISLVLKERHDVDRIRIGREGLVTPIKRAAPINDLVHLAGCFGQHLLAHRMVFTAGMAQITASTTRLRAKRLLISSAEEFCACAEA